MESAEAAGESLSFMDQCKVICLGYISAAGKEERKSGKAADPDAISSLCNIADQEVSEFGEEADLRSLVSSAALLVQKHELSIDDKEKLEDCTHTLHSFLTQEAFDECATELAPSPIDSWEKLSSILHLVYKTCATHESSKLGIIIDFGVRYMRKSATDFVTKEGGWRVLGGEPHMQKSDDSIISSSMVVVPRECAMQEGATADLPHVGATGDAEVQGKEDADFKADSVLASPKNQAPVPLSPLNTPPYSFPSSVTTDDERDSLATPPELVERPQMTESYLQAMGEQARRISSASGNGFELIDSENGGSEDNQKPTQSIDDVKAFDPEQEVQGEADDESPVVAREAAQKHEFPEEPAKEDSILGGYLPHISLGIAAATAIAGFLVMKKNM